MLIETFAIKQTFDREFAIERIVVTKMFPIKRTCQKCLLLRAKELTEIIAMKRTVITEMFATEDNVDKWLL